MLVLSVAMMLTGCATKADLAVAPSNGNIHYTGRYNLSNPDRPQFVYPGTKMLVEFKGTGLTMNAKAGSGWFMVTIDNAPAKKINFSKDVSSIVLADNLAKGNHRAEIMLCFEAYNTRPVLYGFVVKGGTLLKAEAPKGPKLEFIGNSITCGYGTEAKKTDGTESYNDSTENHYYSYAQEVTRRLNAETMVVARSGIGAYRNYAGNVDGEDNTMPDNYDLTLLYDKSQQWDFSKFRPEIICVNIGTNDLSTAGYKIELYEKAYEKFIRHLRKIQPNAKIIMITGSMLNGEALADQKAAFDRIMKRFEKDGVKQIYRFDLSPQTGSLGYGADYHPSIAQQKLMADEITPFIQKLLSAK